MGYSSTVMAAYAYESIAKQMKTAYGDDGTSNVFNTKDGTKFFTETGREQYDGAITGTIYKYVESEKVRAAGSYRIEADGIVTRFYGSSKEMREKAKTDADAKYEETYGEKSAMFQVI